MMRRYPRVGAVLRVAQVLCAVWLVVALIQLLTAEPVAADNCGTFEDCFNQANSASEAAFGLGLLTVLSLALDFVPVVGTGKGLIEMATGKDLITGEELSPFERSLGLMGLIPVGGGALKGAGKAVSHIDEAADIIKHGDDVADVVKHGDDVARQGDNLPRGSDGGDSVGPHHSLDPPPGPAPDRGPAIPGDVDFIGPIEGGSWRLSPNGQGAHMAERVNVRGRPDLAALDTPDTPRFYPTGTPEAAGQAHIRLHQATRAEGISLRGGNPDMNDADLLDAYARAYSRADVQNIRGDFRAPNGDLLGTNLTPGEAWSQLMEWLERTRS